MIETLSDNHAILLLYLAGELPEADRLEVAKRLAADPILAKQLAELSRIHLEIGSNIAALDEVDLTRSRLSTKRAISAAVSSIESWRFGPRLAQQPVATTKRRIWAWVAPASLAASILIAAIVWMEHRPAGVPANRAFAITTRPTTPAAEEAPAAAVNDPDSNLALLQQSFATGFEATPRRVAAEARSDGAARSDLSDYLLKTEVGQQ